MRPNVSMRISHDHARPNCIASKFIAHWKPYEAFFVRKNVFGKNSSLKVFSNIKNPCFFSPFGDQFSEFILSSNATLSELVYKNIFIYYKPGPFYYKY